MSICRKWIWNRLFFISLVQNTSNALGKESADTKSMATWMPVTKVVRWYKYFYKESCWRIGAFWSIWSPVDYSRGRLVHWCRKIASWLFWCNTCEKIWPQDGIQITLQSAPVRKVLKVRIKHRCFNFVSLWIRNKGKNWPSQVLSSRIKLIFNSACNKHQFTTISKKDWLCNRFCFSKINL